MLSSEKREKELESLQQIRNPWLRQELVKSLPELVLKS